MLSQLLTRFVICHRHGHEWRKAHRREGSSYERCMGCDDVRALQGVRDQINAFATAKPRDGAVANHYVEMNVLLMDEWVKTIDTHLGRDEVRG